MAAEMWTVRIKSRLTELALKLAGPARRVCGSVSNSVFACAVIAGAYLLLSSSIYLHDPWFHQVGELIKTVAAFSIVSALANIKLLFGILLRKDTILKYILCWSVAVYMLCIPLSLFLILGTAITTVIDILLWEILRLGICLLQLGLMYCLLAELRGESESTSSGGMQPPPADGWLKNNMARHSPPSPAGHDPMLKVQVDTPAVFTPSSCTTTTPVHTNNIHAANKSSSNA